MSDVGIKQLAKHLSISTASVSRALNNPTRVSESMRKRVQDAAEEFGYRPNRLGSGLRTSRTGNIIAIIPDISDTFNSGVIKSLESIAAKHGYSILFGNTQGRRDREIAYGAMVHSRQADGIISFSHRLPFTDRVLENPNFELPPLVNSCEPLGMPNIPLVSIDNKSAARDVTQHLIDLGHQRIAVITGNKESPSSNLRLEGYQQSLQEAGLPYHADLVQYGSYTLESGVDCTLDILKIKHRPSAIFCFCDEIALGCLSTLESHNLRVPDDISVIGFDDIRFAEYFSPALTTIRQPVSEIGERCFELLMQQINGEIKADAKPQSKSNIEQAYLPYQLIIRNSTDSVRKQ